jgi:hypothetical protein
MIYDNILQPLVDGFKASLKGLDPSDEPIAVPERVRFARLEACRS